MDTNISRQAQKAKLFALSKEAFLEDLLKAQPRDYQERNWLYHWASVALSYPLQLISILAGSYLLYDIARFVWQLESYNFNSYGVFALCIFIFFGIESLRRWLVNTTGYHYLATFQAEDGKLIKGEWLWTKLYCLMGISTLLITTGTIGAYQYSRNNAPQAQTIDIKEVTSPLEGKAKNEKKQITQLDKNIQTLLQTKKTELSDARSYAIWEGKEFLLPEVKTRHENYDRQIAQMQAQRQKHLEMNNKYEEKLFQKEQITEQKNESIKTLNDSHKELYAGVSAGIWLSFEMILVFMLSYTWIYKYGVKREKLLESIEVRRKIHLTEKFKPLTAAKQKLGLKATEADFPHLFENKAETDDETQRLFEYYSQKTKRKADFNEIFEKKKTIEPIPKHTIGFEKWYEQKPTAEVVKPQPEIIIKEIPVIKEVIIERKIEVPVEVITNTVEQGFAVHCAHCGKAEIKKRPAKYCSNACRNKAWKDSKA
jgi:hypothetical protein